MTLGTVTVAAGVISIDLPAAVVTLFQVAAKVSRPTGLDILPGPRLTGQQLISRTPIRWFLLSAARYIQAECQAAIVCITIRSPKFLQTDLIQTLRWLRMIGDTVFALGSISWVYFTLDLMFRRPGKTVAPVTVTAPAEAA